MEEVENIARSRVYGVFSPAEAVEAFNALFLDEKVCTRWVLSRLHPDYSKCPECKEPLQDEKNFLNMKRCRCKACGKWFTATTGTMLQGVQLRPEELYLLAVLSGLNVEPKEIARVVKVHLDTVRLWQGKFKAMEGGAI